MNKQKQTKAQLLAEQTALRQRVNELEGIIASHHQIDAHLHSVSADRFFKVILSLSNHIYVSELEPDGHRQPLYLSPDFETLTGYPVTHLADWGFWSNRLIHPDDRAITAIQMAQLTLGQNSEVEYRLIRADGQISWVRDNAGIELINQQKVIYGVVTDITDRKNREEALIRLMHLSRALVTVEDPTVVLDQAIKLAVDIAPIADRGSLQILAEDESTLQTITTSTPNEPLDEVIIFKPGVGIAGYTLTKNKIVNVADVLTDKRFAPSHLPLRFRSLLVAPLVVKGHLVGTLSLSSEEVNAFSTADETLVQLIADQIAWAMENARLAASHRQTEKFRKTSQFLQTIIDTLAAQIAILDEQGFIVAVNANWRHQTEMDDHPQLNYGVGDNYLAECDSASGDNAQEAFMIAQGIRRVMAGQQPHFHLEYPAHTPDKKQWFDIRATRFQNEDAFWVVVTREDITERCQAQEQLQLLAMAIASTEEGVLITNAQPPPLDAAIVSVNHSQCHMSGYSQADLMGQSLRLLCGPKTDMALLAQMNQTLPQNQSFNAEIINYRQNGTEYHVAWHISPILDSTGRITHYVSIQRDVTQIRLLEGQFLQMQKLEAVGRLAGGVAHDFNNYLTVIKGYSELLMGRLNQQDQLWYEASQIKKAADQAADLTRQLLIFSRKETVKMRTLNLNDVIGTLKSLLERLIGEDIHMVTTFTPDLTLIKADQGQMDQVIMNLAANARDAMPNGGKLIIETANLTITEAALLFLSTMPPGDYVRLTITDTGQGMSEEILPHIFEPFYTTKSQDKGTGLGLSTVYAIIAKNDGHIQVHSQPGQGTTFKIYLPRLITSLPPSGPLTLPPIQKELTGGGETILVVEDEVWVRKLIGQLLQQQGYRVLEAEDGLEALTLCQKYQGRIDLLLTDVVIPSGLNGQELAEQVKGLLPNIKILYMSGYTLDTIIARGLLEADMTFLQKPFTQHALLYKVREVLDNTLSAR